MVDLQQVHQKPSNVDQTSSLDAVDSFVVFTGGWERRRRRTAEIGRGEDNPKARVRSRGLVTQPIHTKLCGEP